MLRTGGHHQSRLSPSYSGTCRIMHHPSWDSLPQATAAGGPSRLAHAHPPPDSCAMVGVQEKGRGGLSNSLYHLGTFLCSKMFQGIWGVHPYGPASSTGSSWGWSTGSSALCADPSPDLAWEGQPRKAQGPFSVAFCLPLPPSPHRPLVVERAGETPSPDLVAYVCIQRL